MSSRDCLHQMGSLACCSNLTETSPALLSNAPLPDRHASAREIFERLTRELESVQNSQVTILLGVLSAELDRLAEENISLKQSAEFEQNAELSAALRRAQQLQTDIELLQEENEILKGEAKTLQERLETSSGHQSGAVPLSVDALKAPKVISTSGVSLIPAPMPPSDAAGQAIMPSDVQKLSVPPKSASEDARTSSSRGSNNPKTFIQRSSLSATIMSTRSSVMMSPMIRAMRQRLRPVMDSKTFGILSALSLALALFGGGTFIILDVPDSPGNALLDCVMLTITAFFVFEIVVQFIVEKKYPFSFFFWMDMLGTVSMVFEVSFLLATADMDTVVLRTARTAKFGARVGRLFKILKFVLKRPDDKELAKAKILTQRLQYILATRVAALTIWLLMIVPLFSMPLYPKEDRSMEGWIQWLEDSFMWQTTNNTHNIFGQSFQGLEAFYRGESYFPYKVEGYNSLGSLAKAAPARKNNILEVEVNSCRITRSSCTGTKKASISYDFTGPNQLEAGMDIALIVFIMLNMIISTYVQSKTIHEIMVIPLERMIHTVRTKAKRVCEQFMFMEAKDSNSGAVSRMLSQQSAFDDIEHVEEQSELELLEVVLTKLARLAEVHMENNNIYDDELGAMGHDEQAVLVDILQTKVIKHEGTRRASIGPGYDVPSVADHMHTWDFSVLERSKPQLQELVTQFLSSDEIGFAMDFADMSVLKSFCTAVQAQYYDHPYHCFEHACDVLHCVSLLLVKLKSPLWLSEVDIYSMMIAAFCHDVGHTGRTNVFLVEVKHELALRYNDNSPLENMHCATLFQICNDKSTDMFMKASAEDRKHARKVCISTILHTDNVNHFQMVKEITSFYELNSEICDAQAGKSVLLESYESDVLHKDKSRWQNLILHFADISNPLKPFPICQAWAWRVLDEFFAQGDEEKKLGIPVGMLNDRATVNRPGSQHGFINFLVAPLVTMTVHIFPVLHHLHHQMASNLEEWRNIWVKENNPPIEEIAKKDADVEKIKACTKMLKDMNANT